MRKAMILILSIIAFVLFIGCSAQQELTQDTGRLKYIPEDEQENSEVENKSKFRIVTKKTALSDHPRFQREFDNSKPFVLPDHIADKLDGQLQRSIGDPSINIIMVYVKCKSELTEEMISVLEYNGLLINTYSEDIATVRAKKTDLLAAAEIDFVQYMQLSTRLEPSKKQGKPIYSDI